MSADVLDAIVKVCQVMIKYYDDYMTEIWPEEKQKISTNMRSVKSARPSGLRKKTNPDGQKVKIATKGREKKIARPSG